MSEDSEQNKPGLDELVSLNEAAQISGLSPSHLRLLVSHGEIWGKKVGRNWLTTKNAVDVYLKKVRKPGPKTKNKK